MSGRHPVFRMILFVVGLGLLSTLLGLRFSDLSSDYAAAFDSTKRAYQFHFPYARPSSANLTLRSSRNLSETEKTQTLTIQDCAGQVHKHTFSDLNAGILMPAQPTCTKLQVLLEPVDYIENEKRITLADEGDLTFDIDSPGLLLSVRTDILLFCFILTLLNVFLYQILAGPLPAIFNSLILTIGCWMAPTIQTFFHLLVTSFGLGIGAILYHRLPITKITPVKKAQPTPTIYWWSILGLTLLGSLLRFRGIDFGLPSLYHPDETTKALIIEKMKLSGNLNPGYFTHPSMLLYLTYFVNELLTQLNFEGTRIELITLSGRIVSATAGTLTIPVFFKVCSKLYTMRTALYSTILFTFLPLSLACSRYLKEDSLVLFWVMSFLLVFIKAIETRSYRTYLFSATLVGVAFSAKYSALVLVSLIVAAPWILSRRLRPDRQFLRSLWATPLLFLVGFIVCSPFALLDFKSFFKGSSAEGLHMLAGHVGERITAISQLGLFHAFNTIPSSATPPVAVVALVGLGFLFARRQLSDLVVLVMLILFYGPAEYIVAKLPLPHRHILPCLPFLCIATGELLDRLNQTSLRWISKAGATILVVFLAIRSFQLVSDVTPDTRTQMEQWMLKNLPLKSRILTPIEAYSPQFANKEFLLFEKIFFKEANVINRLSIESLQNSEFDFLVMTSLQYNHFLDAPTPKARIITAFRDVFENFPVVQEFANPNAQFSFNNPVITLFDLKKNPDLKPIARGDSEFFKSLPK